MLRSCRFCGAPFETQQNAQKYCSRECVREAARRRDREYRRRKRQAAALAAGTSAADAPGSGKAPARKAGPRTNAERWALALEVMRETGKTYGQCQAEGLFNGRKGGRG